MSFEIRLERLLDTTPEVAFHHWVDAAERRGWYGGDESDWTVDAETDLRVGGRFWVAWGPSPDRMYREEGSFEVVDPPHRLVYTSRWTPAPSDPAPAIELLVTVTFADRGGKTLLTLLETGYPSAEVRDLFLTFIPDGLRYYERSLPS